MNCYFENNFWSKSYKLFIHLIYSFIIILNKISCNLAPNMVLKIKSTETTYQHEKN